MYFAFASFAFVMAMLLLCGALPASVRRNCAGRPTGSARTSSASPSSTLVDVAALALGPDLEQVTIRVTGPGRRRAGGSASASPGGGPPGAQSAVLHTFAVSGGHVRRRRRQRRA